MADNKWFEGLAPEDLPEGDLRLVAERCGMEVAISLAEQMGGIQLYIRNAGGLIARKKEEYIRRNFNGSNHKALALATGYSERWVYEVLRRKGSNKQKGLFESFTEN